MIGWDSAEMEVVDWWREKLEHRFHDTPTTGKIEEELAELVEDPTSEEEAADVVIALMIYAYRMKWDLPAAIVRKTRINHLREWGEPDANGVVRHL